MKIFGIIVLIIIILAIIIFSLKDPDTGKSYWHNFVEAYGRFKNIYHELQEKRRYPEQEAAKAAKTDAESAASPKEETAAKTDAESGASHEEKPAAKTDAESGASHEEKPAAKTDAESGASHEEKPASPKPVAQAAVKAEPHHITLGEKAHDFVDAASAASFKTIDHKKLFAKLTGKDKKEK
jgi:hypothetical protein